MKKIKKDSIEISNKTILKRKEFSCVKLDSVTKPLLYAAKGLQQLCGIYYCDCQYKMVSSSVRFSRVFITQKKD